MEDYSAFTMEELYEVVSDMEKLLKKPSMRGLHEEMERHKHNASEEIKRRLIQ